MGKGMSGRRRRRSSRRRELRKCFHQSVLYFLSLYEGATHHVNKGGD